jgi:hypothetical protein
LTTPGESNDQSEPPGWKQSPRFEHLYVVVRFETGDSWVNSSIEDRVTLTKAFFLHQEAERETERLNKSNGPKHCVYRWMVAVET